jgi:transcriptional regulator with GAF, ATPase, and Fis domain
MHCLIKLRLTRLILDLPLIIGKISEALSVTDKENQLLDAALDTLSGCIGVDCCWLQFLETGADNLSLFACRGFTSEMQHEMLSMDVNNRFTNEIVGIGNKIIISDLNRNGHYEVSTFHKAGFRSMVAVPIMTYRCVGIIGVARRNTKRFEKVFPESLMAIGSVIGLAVTKSKHYQAPTLARNSPESKILLLEFPKDGRHTQDSILTSNEKAVTEDHRMEGIILKKYDLQNHSDKMKTFAYSHKLKKGMINGKFNYES